MICGRDTRKSGEYLLDLAIKSAEIMCANIVNLNEVTTPILNHRVQGGSRDCVAITHVRTPVLR